MIPSTLSSVRARVRNLLLLHRDGRREEALQGAVTLAEDLGNSALVLNLLGDFRMDARLRDRDLASDAAREHGQCAADAYRRAAAAAPNCMKTSASYVAALFEMDLHLEAQEEVSRVHKSVRVVDDPQIHNVFFDLDYASGNITKEDRIESAKDAFSYQSSRLADRESHDIDQVLRTLQDLGAHSAIAVAENVAQRYPTSARSQHLLVFLQIELVRTLSPHDKQRMDVMEHAVNEMKMLASSFPNSLAMSHYYAKLLVITGRYSAAETECRRALCIDHPQLPETDQFPGLFSVDSNADRLSVVNNEIIALQKMISTHLNWIFMTADMQDSLTSVKVEMLMNHFLNISQSASDIISAAVENFKSNNSWNLYICPLPEPECSGYWADSITQLERHIFSNHSQFFVEMPAVSVEEVSVDEGLFSALSLRQDSQQQDIMYFRNLDEMFQCLLLLSSIEPPSLDSMRLKLCTEASGILEALTSAARTSPGNENNETLWIKFFEACTVDYRIALLPLVCSFKLEELRNSADVNSYSLDDFDWTFSEQEDVNTCNATSFGFLVESDGMQEEPTKTYPPTFDLLGIVNPTTSEQQGEVKKTCPPFFDLLGDADLIYVDHGQVQQEQLSRTIPLGFDLLGDDYDFASIIEHKPASISNLENPHNTQQDEKGSFDPTANWGLVIDQLPKSSVADPRQSVSDERVCSKDASDQCKHRESDLPETDFEGKTTEYALKGQLKIEDGQTSTSKGRIFSQALMYGTSRRPGKSKPSPPTTKEDWRESFDPYGFESVHIEYLRDLEKCVPKHLCSFCYFEKCRHIQVPPLTHYYQDHGAHGLPCEDCSARFITETALKSHRKFCHGEKDNKPG